MCGRFLLDSDIDDILKTYRIFKKEDNEYKKGDFYPSQNAPIVLKDEDMAIKLAKWGFSYNNQKGLVINARAESIKSKPMFKKSFYSERCIIPANMFYEWKDEGNRKKIKHRIGLQHSNLVSLGGVYRLSLDENSKKQLTFVIITTEAEGAMKEIHSRMPLIIKNEELDTWLDKEAPIKYVEEILQSNKNNKIIIETCEDENHQQLKMF